MKVGIVCPYAWDVPGGVSAHINDLAHALMKKGIQVSVLAPAESDEDLPEFVTSAGEPRAIKYNGSVARLSFGPVTARKVSKWIEEGKFDILHVHGQPFEPVGEFARDRQAVEAAHLLKIGELRHLHAVAPDLPAETPGAERRRFPVVLDEADVVLGEIDADRFKAAEI